MITVATLDQDTLDAFLKENVISIIGFWAAWCGPCKMMSPVLSDFAAKHHKEYAVGKINIDECADLAAEYNIENLPTLLLMKHGKEIDRIIGYMNLNDLSEEIVKKLF